MLNKLLKNQILSPLLPSNQTLTDVDSDQFSDLMEKWTESAMKPPYVGVP